MNPLEALLNKTKTHKVGLQKRLGASEETLTLDLFLGKEAL
jgi:hypothetical protein